MLWISGTIIALILGIAGFALLYGKYAEWKATRCAHDWEQYEVSSILYRGCVRCDRIERFEPDCGGNTSGHWDRIA